MYTEHWGLKRTPFENVNNPSFFYYSNEHKEVLARMSYAVQLRKPGVVITGECGTGKTFVSRVLREMCKTQNYAFLFVTNPRMTPLEFIKEIYFQLGGSQEPIASWGKMDFLRGIQNCLEDFRSKGAYPVIIIDEAQSIEGEELLEEIRLLLNMQGDDSTLFTLIILGQPPLEEKIDAIPQFKQRIAVRYRLVPLTAQETREYVEYRLKVSGSAKPIFTDAAIQHIYEASRGMPRIINNICDLALLSGFIRKAEFIDRDIIVQVAHDLDIPGGRA